MNSLTVFSPDYAVMSYTDKRGASHSITAEGAIVKGGKTLMGMLKDSASFSALRKAEAGKYRSASDILCVAFPAVGKSAEKLIGTPWANKSTMATLLYAVKRQTPRNEKGFSPNQQIARALADEILKLTAFKDTVDPLSTIDQ